LPSTATDDIPAGILPGLQASPSAPPRVRGPGVATELGGRAMSLADVVSSFFITQPEEMFALDRFHPSGAGYRRTAKAILPSVLAALGYADPLPFGHHGPAA